MKIWEYIYRDLVSYFRLVASVQEIVKHIKGDLRTIGASGKLCKFVSAPNLELNHQRFCFVTPFYNILLSTFHQHAANHDSTPPHQHFPQPHNHTPFPATSLLLNTH